MAIVTQPLLRDALVTEATVLLQVRSAAEPDRLVAALSAARADIIALSDSPDPQAANAVKYASAAIPLPEGPIIMIDFGGLATEVAQTVPELVAQRLNGCGVTDAELRLPPWSPRTRLVERLGPAARALLRGPMTVPADHPPAEWLLNVSHSWVRGEHTPPAELNGYAIWAETPLTLETLPSVMGAVLAAHRAATIMSTDFATHAAVAAIDAGPHPTVALAAAGQGWQPDQLAQRLLRQRDLIRDLIRDLVRTRAGDLVWAGATVEADATNLRVTTWQDSETPARPPVERLADILIPDAMWYQVLSAGHLERLGGPPPGAVQLAAHRFELTLGEPWQWLPGHPDRASLQARGRSLLGPCLVTADEAFELTRRRFAR